MHMLSTRPGSRYIPIYSIHNCCSQLHRAVDTRMIANIAANYRSEMAYYTPYSVYGSPSTNHTSRVETYHSSSPEIFSGTSEPQTTFVRVLIESTTRCRVLHVLFRLVCQLFDVLIQHTIVLTYVLNGRRTRICVSIIAI